MKKIGFYKNFDKYFKIYFEMKKDISLKMFSTLIKYPYIMLPNHLFRGKLKEL